MVENPQPMPDPGRVVVAMGIPDAEMVTGTPWMGSRLGSDAGGLVEAMHELWRSRGGSLPCWMSLIPCCNRFMCPTLLTPTSLKSLRSRDMSSVPLISCSKKACEYMGSPMDSSHWVTSWGDHCNTTSTKQLLDFLADVVEAEEWPCPVIPPNPGIPNPP